MHVLLGLSLLVAQVPPEPTELSRGAIARFGSTHFRHAGSIGWMAISPDGRQLVSMGNDGWRMWDVTTGKQVLFHPSSDEDGLSSTSSSLSQAPAIMPPVLGMRVLKSPVVIVITSASSLIQTGSRGAAAGAFSLASTSR